MPESSFPSRLAFRGAQVFVVLVATMATDSALASPGWSGDVSLGIVGFHYKEFADDDSVLDREDGNIPGVATTLRYDNSTWGIVSSTSFYSGDAAYDGQTQLGIPITTTTKEQMFGFTLHAYRHVAFGGPRGSELYSGLGYQWWGRDISPTRTSRGTTVSGLYEEYRWWTAFLGGQLSLTSDSTSRWDIDARILRTINPTVEVDFAGSTDNVELPLGDPPGIDGRRDLRGGHGRLGTSGRA